MENTINDLMCTTTLDYIATINVTQPPDPKVIESEILDRVNVKIDSLNQNLPSRGKHGYFKKLLPWQIAQILLSLYHIRTICTSDAGADRNYDLLAIYQPDGINAGLYVTDDETFRALIRKYNASISMKDITEVMIILRDEAKRDYRCTKDNLIAVNNGIFDFDKKVLLPFDPDLIFLSKSRVNYVSNPVNPVIYNPEDGTYWDVESWMQEFAPEDPSIVQLLWEVMSAVVRPFVAWNKSAWFYSETGNNGKGTLCELMRQLVGPGSYASVSLAALGGQFALEPIVTASAIIVDENDVGTYIDKAANLKSLITHDVVTINRKYKPQIPFRFYGFMVQCLNEMPRVKDKSDSFFRRQLFVPFTKSFTGHERRYIKNDYLHRPEVLEYVLWKVLNMTHYELSEPEACKDALNEYKEYNDPVRQFLDEILPQTNWDLLPFNYLYDCYTAWSTKYAPSGKQLGVASFNQQVLMIIADSQEWVCPGKRKQIRASKRMSATEPLIIKYNLVSWMNEKYKNNVSATPKEKCTPIPGQFVENKYRGLLRINPKCGETYDSTNDTTEPEQE